MRPCLPFTLTCALVLALTAATAHASDLTGGDPCALIEALPGPKDPVRQAKPVRSAFKNLDRAGSDRRKLGKVHDALVKTLAGAMDEATRVFHPKGINPRKWTDRERARARKYLDKWAGGPQPLLRVGDVGFEPVPGIRATLMYTACRSDRPELALSYGRRAATDDEASARAFAALLLAEAGRTEEARELLPGLEGDTFLVAWVIAELAADTDERRRKHAVARRRISTPAQAAAIDAQARRHEAGDAAPTPTTPAGDRTEPQAEKADDESTP